MYHWRQVFVFLKSDILTGFCVTDFLKSNFHLFSIFLIFKINSENNESNQSILFRVWSYAVLSLVSVPLPGQRCTSWEKSGPLLWWQYEQPPPHAESSAALTPGLPCTPWTWAHIHTQTSRQQTIRMSRKRRSCAVCFVHTCWRVSRAPQCCWCGPPWWPVEASLTVPPPAASGGRTSRKYEPQCCWGREAKVRWTLRTLNINYCIYTKICGHSSPRAFMYQNMV